MGLLPRAVIYCRCSTEEESQVDALRNQVAESERCVEEQGWRLVDRYVESKSGTTTKGRSEYNRLFEDLLADKFEIIVIKSQDRLMRNVKDWYLFLDRMLTQRKRLFMYIDRKFYTADDALITGIKAILAEEYSRELSKKINNAHRNRQQNGGRPPLTSRVFGFRKNPNGSMAVVEAEAEVIRRIYEYSAAGYGSRAVAHLLSNQGIETRGGGSLSAGSIGRMIRNPLYKGVMVLNRTHFDFETKQTIRNPESQWIYKRGIVPPIVDEALWTRANQAVTERAKRFSPNGDRQKGNGAGRYDLSGKIICGLCGSPYYRTWRRGYADKAAVIVEWKCSGYLKYGRKNLGPADRGGKAPKQDLKGCDNSHLEETVLFSLLEQISGQYYDWEALNKEKIINRAAKLLSSVLSERTSDGEMKRLEERENRILHQKDVLLTKLLDGVITDQDYQKRNRRLEEELESIQAQREAAQPNGIDRSLDQSVERRNEQGINQRINQRINQIKARLGAGGLERAAVSRMLLDIEKILVYEWHIEICFYPAEGMGTAEHGLVIATPYPFSPTTEKGRRLDREKIMEFMKETPNITARRLSREMDRPLKLIQNRIKELREEGRIRFRGSGGHGEWEVLK